MRAIYDIPPVVPQVLPESINDSGAAYLLVAGVVLVAVYLWSKIIAGIVGGRK